MSDGPGGTENPEVKKPTADQLVGEKISALEADGKQKREAAGGLLGAAAAGALLAITGEIPAIVGAMAALGGTGFGYRMAAEARNSANEAIMLRVSHFVERYKELRGEELAAEETASPPPAGPAE